MGAKRNQNFAILNHASKNKPGDVLRVADAVRSLILSPARRKTMNKIINSLEEISHMLDRSRGLCQRP